MDFLGKTRVCDFLYKWNNAPPESEFPGYLCALSFDNLFD